MSIHIIATSHIAQESIDEVVEAISKYKPDCIAVELDVLRYQSLKTEQKEGHNMVRQLGISTYTIMWIFKKIQEWLGSKVGVLPGSEMLKAIEVAEKNQIPVALIDQDIRITLHRIKKMPRSEKLKLFWHLIKAPFMIAFSRFSKAEKIDLSKVPENRIIEFAVQQFKKEFPYLYNVLVDERNKYMSQRISELKPKFENILVVVGAGHKQGIQNLLEK